MGEIEAALARKLVEAPEMRDAIEGLQRDSIRSARRPVFIFCVPVQRPHESIARDDSCGAQLLGGKTEESVPRTDVENGLAVKIGQMQ